jgi:hypothetical protein
LNYHEIIFLNKCAANKLQKKQSFVDVKEELPMNILNISPVFPPLWHYGGSVTTSFAMARELAGQGHAMFALTTGARYRSDQQVPISQDTE